MIREENKTEYKCVYTEIDQRVKQGLGYVLTPEMTKKLIKGKFTRMQLLQGNHHKMIEPDQA
jgi:hypothetical protein